MFVIIPILAFCSRKKFTQNETAIYLLIKRVKIYCRLETTHNHFSSSSIRRLHHTLLTQLNKYATVHCRAERISQSMIFLEQKCSLVSASQSQGFAAFPCPIQCGGKLYILGFCIDSQTNPEIFQALFIIFYHFINQIISGIFRK